MESQSLKCIIGVLGVVFGIAIVLGSGFLTYSVLMISTPAILNDLIVILYGVGILFIFNGGKFAKANLQ